MQRLRREKRERQEEQDLAEVAWVSDTQLQLRQLSYLDANGDKDQQEASSFSLSGASWDASDNGDYAGPSC